MMDPLEKGSESEDQMSSRSSTSSPDQKKACADCGTTKTPLWRGGPAGPKSLCNACGIRSRKKRRDSLGLNKGPNDKKSSRKVSGNHGGNLNSNQKLGDGLKQRLLALGREVMMRRSRSPVEKPIRSKLGEEEQAAVLLMALSYGSVSA